MLAKIFVVLGIILVVLSLMLVGFMRRFILRRNEPCT